MKYFAVVNFVCLPYDEFTKEKGWYAYFRNIGREEEGIHGCKRPKELSGMD